MEKINTTVKKWGNSFGIILPSEIIRSQDIKEGTKIEILINLKDKSRGKDIFGILKGKMRRDTDSLLKEVDEDFEDHG